MTSGCVEGSTTDCATLQAAYDAMDPSAGKLWLRMRGMFYRCLQPTTTPLSTTANAMIGGLAVTARALTGAPGMALLAWYLIGDEIPS